ncbi:MAG: DNA polymerase III subunit delta [Eubacteriales bacterium]
MTVTELSKKLKSDPRGVYLFYGEEEYLKRRYLEQIRSAVIGDDPEASFNHIKISGDLPSLSAELDGLALLGGDRLIELWDTDFSKIGGEQLESLCEVLSAAEDTVILYTHPDEFPAGTPKKPSPQLAALQKCTVAVHFERQKPAALQGWLARHATAQGCFLSPELCRKMIDYCSADMFVLAGETEKVCAYVMAQGRNVIEEKDILTAASPSAIYGAFDFANALLDRDKAKAFILLSDMIRRKEKPQEILGTVSRMMSDLLQIRVLRDCGMTPGEIASKLKMHEYVLSLRLQSAMKRTVEQLEQTAARCREADRKIKSTRLDSYRVIELLILQL